MLLKERIAKRIQYKGLKLSKTEIDCRPDIRDLVVKELDRKERTIGWLATKMNVQAALLYQILVRKNANLNEDKLDSINEILGTNY